MRRTRDRARCCPRTGQDFPQETPCRWGVTVMECPSCREQPRHVARLFKEGLHMSRVATPQQSTTPHSQHTPIPHEKIAMRAYEKWCKRGCPHGTDRQDWYEAEMELRNEMMRGGSGSTPQRR